MQSRKSCILPLSSLTLRVEPYPEEVNLYARASTRGQDWSYQLRYLKKCCQELSLSIGLVGGETCSGKSLDEDQRPVLFSLLEKGGALLATDLTRYARPSDYDFEENRNAKPDFEGDLSSLMSLYEVQLYTILPPDKNSEQCRAFLQRIERETPKYGRPFKGAEKGSRKRREEKALELALRLYEEGTGIRAIAEEILRVTGCRISPSGVLYWVGKRK